MVIQCLYDTERPGRGIGLVPHHDRCPDQHDHRDILFHSSVIWLAAEMEVLCSGIRRFTDSLESVHSGPNQRGVITSYSIHYTKLYDIIAVAIIGTFWIRGLKPVYSLLKSIFV